MQTSHLRTLSSLTAALVLSAAAAIPAFAQDAAYRAQLDRQLEAARGLFANQNIEVAAGPFFGSLEEDGRDTYTLQVRGGKKYYVVGVCDTDCTDLDIRLLNAQGTVLAQDQLEDGAPLVELVPSISGSIRIEVTMFKCSSEPCFFAVEAYQGR
jgi:hypothetical protein